MVVLVDMNYVAYNSFHGHKASDRTNGALIGLLNAYMAIHNHYGANCKVFFCRDAEESWRKSLFPGYKDGRDHTHREAVHEQMDQASQCLANVPNVWFARYLNYEADDIIAILAYRYRNLDERVIIYSSDNDFLHLLPIGVEVAHSITKNSVKTYDEDYVAKKYSGLEPKYLSRFRAIRGDKSDNIPAVIKGEKLAVLAEFVRDWVDGDVSWEELADTKYKKYKKFQAGLSTDEGREALKLNYKLMDLTMWRHFDHSLEPMFETFEPINPSIVEQHAFSGFLSINFKDFNG